MKPSRFSRTLRWGALLVLAVAGDATAWALDPDRSIFQYNCQTWRRSNGLPANAVTAMAQSANGRLWFGTFQGLVSFDGIGFRVVTSDRENKVITAMAPRPDGGLWFGLDRGGLQFWDGKKLMPVNRPEWDAPFTTVRALELSRDGTLFVVGIGLAGALKPDGTFTSLLPVPNADVFSVHEDPLGRVWLGTSEKGLFYWQNGELHQMDNPHLGTPVISAIAVDHAGNIWVGTANGLRCFNARFEEVPTPEFSSQPKAIHVDRHGAVWIGTASSGLIRHYRGKFETFRKHDGLASDRVVSIGETVEGSVWIGTEDGVSQLSDVKFPILSAPEGLAQESCHSVSVAPDGSLWVATPNGISHYVNGSFTSYGQEGANGFRSPWIKKAVPSRSGDVYVIGAAKNIDRVRDGQVVDSWTFDTWPWTVAEDSRGLLVVMGANLMRLRDGQLVPELLADGKPVSLLWIHDLFVARDDTIWVAAVDGIQQIKDGVLRNLCHENGIYESAFYYLTEDDDGAIWAAQSTGIARIKNGKMSQITKSQGLHENTVYAIVPDKQGSYWMDSSRGIFRVSQAELNAVADGTRERVQSEVFDGEDAVKTNDKSAPVYSGARTGDGRIWFPSSQGVIMIDPKNLSRDVRPPVTFIERVLIDGQEFSPDEAPQLQPTAGNLEFDYAALDYRAPQKVRYRYRLDGYENDWVDAGGRRSAFYTNVAHGTYRFQVQASNADGVWNTEGATYELTLPPRYFETLWFRTICGAALLGLGAYVAWMLHLRRKHVQLQQTHELLEAKVAERTAELTAEIEERKKMQAEVERVHRELLEISRQAGMAEVATGVLHNVGNVLTSVNVSTTLLGEKIRDSKTRWVDKLRDLVHANAADLGAFFASDPRGRQVPEFLERLSTQLAAERAELIGEIESLSKNVEHIKDIVVMQQNYATVSGVTESVGVVELVEDAIRMNSTAFVRHEVTLVRDYRATPIITVEKHKVLQILVNLFRNAKYACDDSGRADKEIVVRITAESGRVKIAVIDNGVGIPPANLTRIFSYGFTTRKRGHGFGLHNGALAAKNLGGSLTVQSEGEGLGAEFTLEIPVAMRESVPV